MQTRRPLIERFEEKFIPVTESGCWIWVGASEQSGYGSIGIYKSGISEMVSEYAHRVSYELYRGSIPEGLHIDHLCRVRCCVNPDHLRVVTNRENTLCGESYAAQYRRRSTCSRGHFYTPENTRLKGTVRVCIACVKIRNDQRYHPTGELDKREWVNGRLLRQDCKNTRLYPALEPYLSIRCLREEEETWNVPS